MHFLQRRKTMFGVLFYPVRLQFIMISLKIQYVLSLCLTPGKVRINENFKVKGESAN